MTSAQAHSVPSFIVSAIPSEQHASQPLPFLLDHIYIISDSRPYIDFQFQGHPPKAADAAARRDGILELIAQRTDWVRWNLAKQLSADRRLGRHELALKVPQNTTFRCYVVPEKVVSITDTWAMIEAVESELDRPIAWSEERRRTTRSWVHGERHSSHSILLAALEDIEEELGGAQALRHYPPLEPGQGERRLVPAPEVSLISHWAVQRGNLLSVAIDRLEQECKDLERRQREHHPKRRKDALVQRQSDVLSELARARMLHSLTLQQSASSELSHPIHVGPLVQRDLRFRRLLRAFAPRTSEISHDQPGQWSRLPPLSLNRLFECWGAVWLVDQFRQLGFQGGVDKTQGSTEVAGCTFLLQRDGVRVTLEFEPHPARLDFANLPALDERLVSAEEWAVARQFSDPERPFFGSHDICSPDYLLRIEGTGRPIFAIGDACLADPCYHDKDDKPETLRAYRRSIMLKSSTGLVRCEPLGLFVLYPGPTERWSQLETNCRKDDIWLLCPQVSGADSTARMRVHRMLTHLLARAT